MDVLLPAFTAFIGLTALSMRSRATSPATVHLRPEGKDKITRAGLLPRINDVSPGTARQAYLHVVNTHARAAPRWRTNEGVDRSR